MLLKKDDGFLSQTENVTHYEYCSMSEMRKEHEGK